MGSFAPGQINRSKRDCAGKDPSILRWAELVCLLGMVMFLAGCSGETPAPLPAGAGTPSVSAAGQPEKLSMTITPSVALTPTAITAATAGPDTTQRSADGESAGLAEQVYSTAMSTALATAAPVSTQPQAADIGGSASVTAATTQAATRGSSPEAPATAPTLSLTPTRVPQYVFPVQPVSATTYGEYHHDYPATDIFCPIGSLFVAPTSGVVDYVSTEDIWDPKVDDPATRGGLSVAIVGDDGVRYYGSHLSAVQSSIMPGVRVTAGQPLGRTGKSGDARYVDPHLHFGISPPTTPTDWQTRRGTVSPYKYLRAWAAGTQLWPVLTQLPRVTPTPPTTATAQPLTTTVTPQPAEGYHHRRWRQPARRTKRGQQNHRPVAS